MRRVALLVLVAMALAVPATAADFNVTALSFTDYTINGQLDPTLQLVRGTTYTFEVDAPGHPFSIKTVQSTGSGNRYNNGVTNNGVQTGTLTFSVPLDAPSTLFYNCELHAAMTGVIQVSDPVRVESQTWASVKAVYRGR